VERLLDIREPDTMLRLLFTVSELVSREAVTATPVPIDKLCNGALEFKVMV
jgi:hypothetical protein